MLKAVGGNPLDKAKAQAEKQKGNEHFAKQRWAEAVGCYSAAHISDPTEPTYPLNRAMAYIKLGKFLDAERDCTTALSLSPNTVKALYRRATARVGEGKLKEAREDYQEVLRLDPKNAEAKAGLERAQQRIATEKPHRSEPLALGKLANKTREDAPKPSGSFDVDPIIGSSASQASTEQNGSQSSVEAARLFLQQVGMSTGSEDADAQPRSKPPSSTIPAKLPGETGGLLREVTTRKTAAKPAPKENIPIPAATTPAAGTSRITAAKKTASALNFGASSTTNGAAAAVPRARPQTQHTFGKLTSFEFSRRWKDKSSRLELLASIDAESIPCMIDAMLEPELIAEILRTLVDGARASQGDRTINNLIKGLLTALPKCKRFGMAVAMLDTAEKNDAAHLIDAVSRQDLKSVWEVA